MNTNSSTRSRGRKLLAGLGVGFLALLTIAIIGYLRMFRSYPPQELMRDIKALFDPHNLLNPGVIINDDPEIHIKNLKHLFPVDTRDLKGQSLADLIVLGDEEANDFGINIL